LPNIEFGSLLDCLLLQPGRFEEYYKTAPETYQNSKGQTAPWTWKSSTCREWREEQEAAGNLVCTEEKLGEAHAARMALLSHPDLGEQTKAMLAHSAKQVFVIAEYHDEATGIVVPVKCLTDIVPNADDPDFGRSLLDFKTAKSAAPLAWFYAVRDCGYHIQGAINMDCHNAVPGGDRQDFRHLIVENFAPWEPARRMLAIEFLTVGRMWYLNGLKLYCQCMKSGKWPSYAPQPGAMASQFAGYEMLAYDERIPMPGYRETPEPEPERKGIPDDRAKDDQH
jgi:exodeoxyribonuclease VIII